MEYFIIPGLSRSATLSVEITCVVVLCSIVFLGLAANAQLVISVLRQPELRTSPTYITLVSLAISDVFVLSFFPLHLYGYFKPDISLSVCRVFMLGVFASQFSSSYHLVVFSVLRYVILIKPLFAMKHITPKSTIAICISVWILALSFGSATLPYIKVGTYNSTFRNASGNFCAVDQRSTVFNTCLFCLLGLIPLFVIACFHTAKAYKIHRKIAQTVARGVRRQVSSKVVLGIVISYVICAFLPGVTWNIVLANPDTASLELVVVLYFLTTLTYLNSAIDPLFYFFLSDKAKHYCFCLWKDYMGRGNMNANQACTISRK